jgi:predicted ATP-dependent endonuclease of OLD family
MRLCKFQIRAFRCIYDTGLVDVTDAVALIGKNESGKTAILTALTHLNKDKPVDEQDVCEDLSDNLDENHRIVEGTFELSDSEIKTLQE